MIVKIKRLLKHLKMKK